MSRAIRDVYGEALTALENEKVVVLDADVSASTKSAIFAKAHPDRFYNVGIAEANMAAMAAGLASVGKIPFINTFGCFLTSNGLNAIRSYASYGRLPIKIAGAYGGLSDSFDGPSHHSLDDVAIMRALPNMEVIVPSDPEQTRWAVKYAAGSEGPVYLRLSRDVFPDIYREGENFTMGKAKTVREGNDCTVIASGLMVGNALKAADMLEAEGISVRVVDMFSIKPLDVETILSCAHETGCIVSAEEHTIYGGLGSAVAEVLAQEACAVPMGIVGIRDTHAECGPYGRLQQKYGIDPEAVAAKVRETVKKKC